MTMLQQCASFLLRQSEVRTAFLLASARLRLVLSVEAIHTSLTTRQQAQLNYDIMIQFSKRIKTLKENFESPDPLKSAEIQNLRPLMPLIYELEKIEEDLNDLEALDTEQTGELDGVIAEEQNDLHHQQSTLQQRILDKLVPDEPNDACDSVILEVYPGVGGIEASLFAAEIFNMYNRFSEHMGWQVDIEEYSRMTGGSSSKRSGPLGGNPIHKVIATVTGPMVYRYLKFESGVHRVQRVPETEKSGKVQTSTATVVVLPKPSEITTNLASKDIKIDTFLASGPGGQHVNKVETAVRVTHLPTKMAVECQIHRSQQKNIKHAMEQLEIRMYNKEFETVQAELNKSRKLQAGSANRNEKIRTYNFPQNRITDHRVKLNLSNLNGMLKGGSVLLEILETLQKEDKLDRLQKFLSEHS